MKYDAILVLGRGIDQKGEIPESSAVVVKKAVELLRSGSSKLIIFSGKWSYHSEVTFPITEAEAMAKYSLNLGLDQNAILLEKDSESTIMNFCNTKQQILEPKNLHSILIVALTPLKERILETAQMVLGPDYKIDFMGVDYNYSDINELVKTEQRKLSEQMMFFKNQGIKPGEDNKISEYDMAIINKGRKY